MTQPDCKRTVLHRMGAIQPLGVLLAVGAADARIEHCSENCAELLGHAPEELLGRPAPELFGLTWPRLARLATGEGRRRLGSWRGAQTATVLAHRRGPHHILELEPGPGAAPLWWDETARLDFLEALAAIRTPEALAPLIAEAVAAASGFGRVVVYRFLPGWDGEVVHERRTAGMEPLQGLRFPAADIPANARELYRHNWQRLIADVEATPFTVRAAGGAQPLDLTHSLLRAVHPVHLDYLRHMGVRASFSLSLLADGELWGLVACHHPEPRVLAARERLALEEIARLASLHLGHLVRHERIGRRAALHERLARLDEELDPDAGGPAGNLVEQLERIQDFLGANAVWLRLGAQVHALGEVPQGTARAALVDWLERRPGEAICHFHRLPEALRGRPELERLASGALRLSLDDHGELLALRQELVEEVRWAGEEAAAVGEDLAPPSPRRSFAAYSEKVRYCAEPWDRELLALAEQLRAQLLDHLQAVQEKHLAYRDPLTGLANRFAFDRALQEAVARGTRFALLFIDLDHFKQVNDSLGHAAGDEVLKAVAGRLRRLLRRGDLVGRLGGDELGVIQHGLADPADAEALARRVVAAVGKPVALAGHTARVGASVGIAVFPDDADTAATLRERADQALYAAKHAGRGTHRRAGAS